MIPYGRQCIDQEDIDSVVSVLKSDYLTQGPAVKKLEDDIAEYCGSKYCVVVSNGTAALHIAVAALGLSDGIEGITSPITFAASANSMAYCGIKPVFADIDSKTYNISVSDIKKRISNRTKLITPVHFAGQACDMKPIKELADDHGMAVLEDAAHAIGSTYKDGSRVGNCKYSDMTTFSFHPVKTITTGEGGAITTNRKDLYEKLCLLRSHGITKDPEKLSQNPGPWYYEMQDLGYNYRMTDFQAALGCNQLKKLESFKERRRTIVSTYNNAFKDIEYLETPFEDPEVDSCFHLYVLKFNFEKIGLSRKELMMSLREKGILTQVHYIPVHLLPYYVQEYGCKRGDYPNAESYYESCLSIPLYPSMRNEDVEKVVFEISHVTA